MTGHQTPGLTGGIEHTECVSQELGVLSSHTSDGRFSSFNLYLNEVVRILTKVYGPVILRGSLEGGCEVLGGEEGPVSAGFLTRDAAFCGGILKICLSHCKAVISFHKR